MDLINSYMNCIVYRLIKDEFFLPARDQGGRMVVHGDYRVVVKSGFNDVTFIKVMNGEAFNNENVETEISVTINAIKERRGERQRPVIVHLIIINEGDSLSYKHITDKYADLLTSEQLPFCISVVNIFNGDIYSINDERKAHRKAIKLIEISYKDYKMQNIIDRDIDFMIANIAKSAGLKKLKGLTVTKIIIAVNILFWLLGLISEQIVGIDIFKSFGVQISSLITYGNQYWRLLTPVFLHANLIHMASNSYFLYVCGETVESYVGPFKFVLLYLATGILGNVVSFFTLDPQVASLGASGACLGIGGVLVYMWIKRKNNFLKYYHNMSSMVIMIIINVFYGFTSSNLRVDNGAHIGGFLSGMLLAFIINKTVGLKSMWHADN